MSFPVTAPEGTVLALPSDSAAPSIPGYGGEDLPVQPYLGRIYVHRHEPITVKSPRMNDVKSQTFTPAAEPVASTYSATPRPLYSHPHRDARNPRSQPDYPLGDGRKTERHNRDEHQKQSKRYTLHHIDTLASNHRIPLRPSQDAEAESSDRIVCRLVDSRAVPIPVPICFKEVADPPVLILFEGREYLPA